MGNVISFVKKNAPLLVSNAALAISVLALWLTLIGVKVDVSGFLGTFPQWFTAFIAGGALIAACISIGSQREIARKRAAVDFFLKTEMDSHLLDAHKKFIKGLGTLKTHLKAGKTLDEFSKTDTCAEIRDYLNLHELLAVGIRQNVFDDHVSFHFWHRELIRAYEKSSDLIGHIQTMPGNNKTYIDLVALYKRWLARVQNDP